MNKYFKGAILFAFIFIGSFLFLRNNTTHANNQTIHIDLNVPQQGGGNPPPPPPQDNPPTISDVSSSTAFTTATISWTASDDLGISAVNFVYGLDTNYGTNGNIVGNYEVQLSDLNINTIYYFKISVTDTGNHTTVFAGSFSTLSNQPPLPDVTPPIISNVQVAPGVTGATITWDTNELADSQINYGLTNNYGSNYFDPAGVLSHSALLLNLNPNTNYHFKIISTDGSGNSASTVDANFTTDVDVVPPPDVSNFVLTTSSAAITLSWDNPTLLGTPDFSKVKVIRKVDSSSVNPNDGVLVYEGALENFIDNNVVINTNYFYTIFSFDTSGNRSPGIFRNGQIFPAPPAPQEICGNNIDDDNNGKTDCVDIACVAWPACVIENPNPTPEVCGNGLDDDANGRTDCADNACSGFAGCVNNPQAKFACNNNVDDDNDGNTDFPDDIGCVNSNYNAEYNKA